MSEIDYVRAWEDERAMFRLPERPVVVSYDLSATAEVERLRELVACLLDNDPNDMAADGVTVLDVWRKDAARALGRST